MKVDYIDHMGDDLSVVNSARVSFDKESEWECLLSDNENEVSYSKVLSSPDKKLIGYLATHGHWSPFAHTSVSFRFKAPIFVARQLVKHQVGLCLSGGTEVTFVKQSGGVSNGTYTKTLKELFVMWNGEIKYRGGAKGRRNVSGSHVRVYDEISQRFVTSHITNVVYSGKKDTFVVKDEFGNTLRATADHQVLTSRGWVAVGDLTLTDQLIRTDAGKPFAQTPSTRGLSADVIARRSFRSQYKYRSSLMCSKCKKNTWFNDLEVDHIVPVSKGGTHEVDNLQLLCVSCHATKTSLEKENNTTLLPKYVSIDSITFHTLEDCFDITVDTHHNFLGNGFVVHNCWNEVSRRYVKAAPELWWPEKWRKAAENVKQGSSDEEYNDGRLCGWLEGSKDAVDTILLYYDHLIEEGMCPEQARMFLPLNTYTEWIWTGSLYAWARVWKQRTYPTAQKETQDCVKLIGPTMERLFPVSWAALIKG